MIIPADLRIGNCLRLVGPDWALQERNHVRRITASDIVDIEFSGSGGYEALLLNEDTLAAAGFTHSTDTEMELAIDENNKLVANPYIQGGYAVQLCCQTNGAGRKPLFLHQLQNLYYILRWEEMAISPTLFSTVS